MRGISAVKQASSDLLSLLVERHNLQQAAAARVTALNQHTFGTLLGRVEGHLRGSTIGGVAAAPGGRQPACKFTAVGRHARHTDRTRHTRSIAAKLLGQVERDRPQTSPPPFTQTTHTHAHTHRAAPAPRFEVSEEEQPQR